MIKPHFEYRVGNYIEVQDAVSKDIIGYVSDFEDGGFIMGDHKTVFMSDDALADKVEALNIAYNTGIKFVLKPIEVKCWVTLGVRGPWLDTYKGVELRIAD